MTVLYANCSKNTHRKQMRHKVHVHENQKRKYIFMKIKIDTKYMHLINSNMLLVFGASERKYSTCYSLSPGTDP